MADIRIVDANEVWWATTKEYTLEIDGETILCRIAETTKSTEFFEYTEGSGWEEADIDGGSMKVVYDAWSNSELED
jgi:hypothetical protein